MDKPKKKYVVKAVCSCIKSRPHAAELHDRKLDGRGPQDADLMIVGMAPGAEEAETGRYFVGAAGQQLKRDLLSAGIVMDDCRIQNVGCYWPPAHNLKALSDERRTEGEAQLVADIECVKPRLIIALGTEALEFLTGKSGITKWAGSVLQTRPGLPPATVIPTLHPSAVIRSWDYHVLFLHDLRKAAAFLRGDNVSPIERRLVTRTNSTPDVYAEACADILRRGLAGEPLACDIETFKGEVSCISFAPSADYSLSVHGEDRKVWQAILDTECPKIWHNAMYDLTFLEARCSVKPKGVVHDTQLMWHAISPELACSPCVGKRLAVLTHLFTNDNYYKDALDDWKRVADWNAFYEYNARDSAVTFEIWQKFEELLDEDADKRATYDFEASLLEPYKNASIRGFKIDVKRKAAKKAAAKRRIEQLEKEMRELLGDEKFNCRSSAQKTKWLKALGSKQPNSDKEAITEVLIKSEPGSKLHQLATLIKEFQTVSKAHDTYYSFGYDRDGRVRTSWIIPGTETGRMANSKSIIFAGGVNLMTIPRGARPFFVADPGYRLVYADLSQAEARLVAYLAGCEPMIEAFETGRDVYKTAAAQMFHKSYDEITYEERYLAKRCVLGLLYGMGAKTWRMQTNIDKGYDYMSLARAYELHDLFFKTFPEIKSYHRWIEELVRRDATLKNMFGRSRAFRTRNGTYEDGTYREAYDYIPQATVPDIVNRAVLLLDTLDGVDLQGQIHDAWLGQVRDDERLDANVREIKRALSMELAIVDVRGVRRTMTIPVEVDIGENWGDFDEKDNPEGLKPYIFKEN